MSQLIIIPASLRICVSNDTTPEQIKAIVYNAQSSGFPTLDELKDTIIQHMEDIADDDDAAVIASTDITDAYVWVEDDHEVVHIDD
jgi:hypothetical protein